MHGIGSHPEVLLLVKPEPSPTDTAAFYILNASFSEVVGWRLRRERGVACDTLSRFEYSDAGVTQTGLR